MPKTNHPLTPNRVCQCRSCGETFSGITAFDKHRKGSFCVEPADVGLEMSGTPTGTYWTKPSNRGRTSSKFARQGVRA